MFYALNDNVYFVKGKKRGCIYDFDTSMLYSLNDTLSQKVDMINNGKLSYGATDDELKKIIDRLIEVGIVVIAERPLMHISKLNGRVCGAKRPHSVSKRSVNAMFE